MHTTREIHVNVDNPDLTLLTIREQEVLEEKKVHQKIALTAIIAAERCSASLAQIREQIGLIISKQINSSRCNNCGNPVAPHPEAAKNNMNMVNTPGNEEDRNNTSSEATKEAAGTVSNKTGNVTSTPIVVPSGWGGYCLLGPDGQLVPAAQSDVERTTGEEQLQIMKEIGQSRSNVQIKEDIMVAKAVSIAESATRISIPVTSYNDETHMVVLKTFHGKIQPSGKEEDAISGKVEVVIKKDIAKIKEKGELMLEVKRRKRVPGEPLERYDKYTDYDPPMLLKVKVNVVKAEPTRKTSSLDLSMITKLLKPLKKRKEEGAGKEEGGAISGNYEELEVAGAKKRKEDDRPEQEQKLERTYQIKEEPSC